MFHLINLFVMHSALGSHVLSLDDDNRCFFRFGVFATIHKHVERDVRVNIPGNSQPYC